MCMCLKLKEGTHCLLICHMLSRDDFVDSKLRSDILKLQKSCRVG